MAKSIWRPTEPVMVGDYQLTPSEAWFREFQRTWRTLAGGNADELVLLEKCIEVYKSNADRDPSVVARELLSKNPKGR